MVKKYAILGALGLFVLALAAPGHAVITDIRRVVKCQKRIAGAGASFARKVIKLTLKCTTEVSECQIECEEGVFGPPCDTNPPPCCDPDDPGSNATYQACLDDAQAVCDQQDVKIANAEAIKQTRIVNACNALTVDELCGADTPGLNFATLNAGCLALDPGYTCNLVNLVDCVGGPLQRAFLDQISGLLQPRAGDAVAVLNLEGTFPDIPVVRKVKGEIPAVGLADVYSITGQAGDVIDVRVKTRNDNGDGTSDLVPRIVLLGFDETTPVGNTSTELSSCNVPNMCGGLCPQIRRALPFDGTFFLAIGADSSCGGGRYRLIVKSPSGAVPALVGDDVPAGSALAAFTDNTAGHGPLD